MSLGAGSSPAQDRLFPQRFCPGLEPGPRETARLSDRDGPVEPAHDGGEEGAKPYQAVIGGLDPPIPLR
jgi:hypothetical protein